jgi:hypothetical protein
MRCLQHIIRLCVIGICLIGWIRSPSAQMLGQFYVATWNGRFVQTNLDFNQFGGDYPFVNYMLDASDWSCNSGPVDVSSMDSTGYPTNNTELSTCGGWETAFLFHRKQRTPAIIR